MEAPRIDPARGRALRARAARAARHPWLHPRQHRDPPSRRRAGGARRGRHLVPRAPRRASRRPARCGRSPAPGRSSRSRTLSRCRHPHHRWAYESAALDLALRQAGTTLAEAVGREPRPVSFVISPGLGDPPTAASSCAGSSSSRATASSSTPARLEQPADRRARRHRSRRDGRLQGLLQRRATPPPDPDLYRRVAEGFPEAYLEDPALTDETDAVLEPYHDRVTWDAPIHSVADVEALSFPPQVLNSKPSRFGRLQRAARLLRLLRRARDRPLRRRHVRARPGPRARSSTSPRSSTRTARTTSPRAPTTTPSRGPACPGARSSRRRPRAASAGTTRTLKGRATAA